VEGCLGGIGDVACGILPCYETTFYDKTELKYKSSTRTLLLSESDGITILKHEAPQKYVKANTRTQAAAQQN
jgi:hypothetical protein